MISFDHQRRLVSQGRDEMMTAFLRVLDRAPNEAQQRDASQRFTTFMENFLEEIVGVVAVGDYPAVGVELVDFTGKGKIMLKGRDAGQVGDMPCGKVGASLTLVMTDVAQFDRHRTDAMIELDQRPLPLDTDPEDDGEDFAEEAAEIADEATGSGASTEDAGWLFTAVEDEPCRLPDGSSITPWAVVHRDLEVFTPVDAKDFVHAAVDHLNSTAAELERDMTPGEVRNAILGVLHARQDEIGIAFHAPYEDAPAVQDNAPAVGEEVPKSKGRLRVAAEAYIAGYDGASADLFADDCPHERGALKDNWITGLEDAKAGKAPRWNRPTPPAANDDGADPRESTGNMAA